MLTEIIQQILAKKLNETSKLLLTVDVCANRQMRSYVGITVHIISNQKLHNVMLACTPFRGHHIAENIVTQFEERSYQYHF